MGGDGELAHQAIKLDGMDMDTTEHEDVQKPYGSLSIIEEVCE
jgi:hypothetical protein